MRVLKLMSAVLAAVLIAAACGGGSTEEDSSGPNIIDAGSASIQLPDDLNLNAAEEDAEEQAARAVAAASEESAGGEVVAEDPATDEAPAEDAEPEPEEPEEDPEAIPLAEDDTPAIVGLLEAFGVFGDCLDGEGFEFTGAPGQDGATAEDFDPVYLQALQLCAAESNILQALQDSAAADAALTADEIEDRNEALLVFADCIELKGWGVEDIQPDARGLLQIGEGGTGLTPPPGVRIFDSPDIAECFSEAAEETGFEG